MTSSENLVASSQFSVALATSESQFRALKGAPGFEPGTSRSAVECSTTELYPLARQLQGLVHYLNTMRMLRRPVFRHGDHLPRPFVLRFTKIYYSFVCLECLNFVSDLDFIKQDRQQLICTLIILVCSIIRRLVRFETTAVVCNL